jgi:hypothetical protein
MAGTVCYQKSNKYSQAIDVASVAMRLTKAFMPAIYRTSPERVVVFDHLIPGQMKGDSCQAAAA